MTIEKGDTRKSIDASSVSIKSNGNRIPDRLQHQSQGRSDSLSTRHIYEGRAQRLRYIVQSYKGRTQSLVAEKTNISENRASRNFDMMINIMTSVHISSGLVLHQMTSEHNRSELGILVHNNEPSSSKLVPKVVPLAVKTATSQQELNTDSPSQ
ncbi:hypothetical protein Tco_0007444 [Tanacetum coccineum]